MDEQAELIRIKRVLKFQTIVIAFMTGTMLWNGHLSTSTIGSAKITGTDSTAHVFQDRTVWEIIGGGSSSFRVRIDHPQRGSFMHNFSFIGPGRGKPAKMNSEDLRYQMEDGYPILEIPISIGERQTKMRVTIGPRFVPKVPAGKV